MSGLTKIEWADRVWNPVTGCTPISPGCANCYAKRMASRLAGRCGYPAEDPFRVTVHEDKFNEPLRWKRPAWVFVGSMTDLFQEEVDFATLDRIFAVMAKCPHITFLVLTKRPGRMWEFYHRKSTPYMVSTKNAPDYRAGQDITWPLPNVWLGVTAENQAMAEERIPVLLSIPAARRFVSIEPMLGPVDLEHIKWARIEVDPKDYERNGVPAPDEMWSTNNVLISRPADELNSAKIALDWVICGGETGPGARPMHPDWPRSLRDQCQSAGVPFFFKQHGEWVGLANPNDGTWPTDASTCIRLTLDGRRADDGYPMQRVGKKHAGRKLDGQVWQEVPA